MPCVRPGVSRLEMRSGMTCRLLALCLVCERPAPSRALLGRRPGLGDGRRPPRRHRVAPAAWSAGSAPRSPPEDVFTVRTYGATSATIGSNPPRLACKNEAEPPHHRRSSARRPPTPVTMSQVRSTAGRAALKVTSCASSRMSAETRRETAVRGRRCGPDAESVWPDADQRALARIRAAGMGV